MKPSVLLDTSFIITLLLRTRPHHAIAVGYFKYFLEEGFQLLFSTIALAEYLHKGTTEELPLTEMHLLTFTWEHAKKCAELDFSAHREKADDRQAVKDDFKLLAQAAVEGCGFVITDDANTLFKYARRLRADGKISFRAVKLEDGFDVSFVNENGQGDLPLATRE